MKNYQKIFFEYLIKKSEGKKNLVDTMIDHLTLSTDTSYRRINGKSQITLNEGIALASHFGISLDALYDSGNYTTVWNKIHDIYNIGDLERYFEYSAENILTIKNIPNAEFIYAAKDIPLFYCMKFKNLQKFKIYTWLKLMDSDFFAQRIDFENFEVPESISRKAERLAEVYQEVNSTEIWSNVTLYALCEQLVYFYQLELISSHNFLTILDEIREMLEQIEHETIKERKTGKSVCFELYQNDLLIMNNSVFIKIKDRKLLFLPYNILSYYYTYDERVCNNYEKSLELILKNSELLSANNKARNIFFNGMYKKIEELRKNVVL